MFECTKLNHKYKKILRVSPCKSQSDSWKTVCFKKTSPKNTMYEYIIAIDACAPHVNFHIKYGFSYSCEYLYKLHNDGRKYVS